MQLVGDIGDAPAVAQQVLGDFHTPLADVFPRRNADFPCETHFKI